MNAPTTDEAWLKTGALGAYVRQARLVDGLCFACERYQPAGDMADPAAMAPRGAPFLVPPGTLTQIHVHNPHAIMRRPADICRPADPLYFGSLLRGHFTNATCRLGVRPTAWRRERLS
ncbi:hypothetical protein J4558_22850 [Leptolyngbya sp. 15MV]|nr:hypothetical protein J4558_22850 [Leptolyngbya sp. 15MV]